MNPDRYPVIDAAALSTHRLSTALRTKADRLRAACEALEKGNFGEWAEAIRARADKPDNLEVVVGTARATVSRLITKLSDGSDEPRYAAALTARRALGALWEVL